MSNPQEILIDQLGFEIQAGPDKTMPIWKERISVWMRPQPWWIPDPAWKWMVKTVIKQKCNVETQDGEKIEWEVK